MKPHLSTEALTRGAGRRPWTVIGTWFAIVAVAVMLMGGLLGNCRYPGKMSGEGGRLV